MEVGAEQEQDGTESSKPETHDPQDPAASGRQVASDPSQIPESQDLEPASKDPIKIQSTQADTRNFRRFLAGLFGIRVEGISGEIDGLPPADVIPSYLVAERSDTNVDPAPEELSEVAQSSSRPESKDAEAEPAGRPNELIPELGDWDDALARMSWVATDEDRTRQALSSLITRARDRFGVMTSGARRLASRALDYLLVHKGWTASALALIAVAVISIYLLSVARDSSSSRNGSVREMDPRNPPAIETRASSVDRQGTPTSDPEEGAPVLGTNFAGAYILSVEHISPNRSMLQLRVPAGLEGTYRAVVTARIGLDFECTSLRQYSDLLFCLGPLLPETSRINLRIFRIDELDGSSELVFETNYTTGETIPTATPSPVFPFYGGAFIWPDRFDQIEIRNKQQSSMVLAPLSALLSAVLLLTQRMLTKGEHRFARRLRHHEVK